VRLEEDRRLEGRALRAGRGDEQLREVPVEQLQALEQLEGEERP